MVDHSMGTPTFLAKDTVNFDLLVEAEINNRYGCDPSAPSDASFLASFSDLRVGAVCVALTDLLDLWRGRDASFVIVTSIECLGLDLYDNGFKKPVFAYEVLTLSGDRLKLGRKALMPIPPNLEFLLGGVD